MPDLGIEARFATVDGWRVKMAANSGVRSKIRAVDGSMPIQRLSPLEELSLLLQEVYNLNASSSPVTSQSGVGTQVHRGGGRNRSVSAAYLSPETPGLQCLSWRQRYRRWTFSCPVSSRNPPQQRQQHHHRGAGEQNEHQV